MHLRPRSLQVFQILQIAITMIIDLHFDEVLEDDEIISGANLLRVNDGEDLRQSIRLAYLGAHFLSSV
jgi:hypothetical protein